MSDAVWMIRKRLRDLTEKRKRFGLRTMDDRCVLDVRIEELDWVLRVLEHTNTIKREGRRWQTSSARSAN